MRARLRHSALKGQRPEGTGPQRGAGNCATSHDEARRHRTRHTQHGVASDGLGAVARRRAEGVGAAVPALLLAGHVTVVVFGPGHAEPWQTGLGLLAVLASAAALVWRAVAPVPVFCAVLAADAVTRALLPEAALTPALPVAVWVALFSLSVRRRARLALPGAALATASTPLPGAGGDVTGPLLDDLLAGALLHLVVVLCGRLRAHREDRRARLLARLADVDGERRAAADAERERLARDLHDTAGHHLTAIAVQGAAALRLAESRPELADEALAHGAAVGRDVLAALAELVAVVADEPDDGPLHDILPPLCAGLERRGVPVALDVRGRPRPLAPAVRATAYRVVQESLTNAMRYAPGAPVTVRLGYAPGEVTVTVTNEPARECEPLGGGLGTGRGLAHLTARAASVGGRLAAGPSRRGGWTVAATLPTRPPRTWWPRAVDVALFTVCAAAPLLAAVPLTGAELCGLAALLTAHAAPLPLRRRAPATALAVSLGVSLAWAAATVAGVLPFAWLAALACAWAVELAALRAVGAYGPARATWPAPVAVGAVGGAVLGLAVLSDPAESAGPGTAALLAGLGLVAVPWLLPVWALGLLTRARRGDGGRWERRVLDAVAARVDDAVIGERRRVATGLHGTVVAHTAGLVRRAEEGLATPHDRRAALTGMTEAARGALAGLRDLLDAMDAARLP
ncbi:Sensor histidine kinase LiaS [Streptomyces sp. YIM 121038]|nr:Sensor histidine kinase LiaS [Streptomyces sp. YIM 121038]